MAVIIFCILWIGSGIIGVYLLNKIEQYNTDTWDDFILNMLLSMFGFVVLLFGVCCFVLNFFDGKDSFLNKKLPWKK